MNGKVSGSVALDCSKSAFRVAVSARTSNSSSNAESASYRWRNPQKDQRRTTENCQETIDKSFSVSVLDDCCSVLRDRERRGLSDCAQHGGVMSLQNFQSILLGVTHTPCKASRGKRLCIAATASVRH